MVLSFIRTYAGVLRHVKILRENLALGREVDEWLPVFGKARALGVNFEGGDLKPLPISTQTDSDLDSDDSGDDNAAS